MIAGYSVNWYGGHAVPSAMGGDPTRIIQGIVTGIGFLGAGVIMKEGLSISGLTTAASIWAASAIGVMVGVGFYAAAIMLAVLSAVCMLGLSKLESRLPQRPAIGITLRFIKAFQADEGELRAFLLTHGFSMATGSVSINFSNGIFIQGVALVRLVQRDNSDVVQLGGEQERGGHKKLLVLRKCEGSGANQLGSV